MRKLWKPAAQNRSPLESQRNSGDDNHDAEREVFIRNRRVLFPAHVIQN